MRKIFLSFVIIIMVASTAQAQSQVKETTEVVVAGLQPGEAGCQVSTWQDKLVATLTRAGACHRSAKVLVEGLVDGQDFSPRARSRGRFNGLEGGLTIARARCAAQAIRQRCGARVILSAGSEVLPKGRTRAEARGVRLSWEGGFCTASQLKRAKVVRRLDGSTCTSPLFVFEQVEGGDARRFERVTLDLTMEDQVVITAQGAVSRPGEVIRCIAFAEKAVAPAPQPKDTNVSTGTALQPQPQAAPAKQEVVVTRTERPAPRETPTVPAEPARPVVRQVGQAPEPGSSFFEGMSLRGYFFGEYVGVCQSCTGYSLEKNWNLRIGFYAEKEVKERLSLRGILGGAYMQYAIPNPETGVGQAVHLPALSVGFGLRYQGWRDLTLTGDLVYNKVTGGGIPQVLLGVEYQLAPKVSVEAHGGLEFFDGGPTGLAGIGVVIDF